MVSSNPSRGESKPTMADTLTLQSGSLTADSLVNRKNDQVTFGLFLCRDKNNIGVEFDLRERKKPMGVSEYTLLERLPFNLKGAIPTVEDIECDLQQLQQQTGDAQ